VVEGRETKRGAVTAGGQGEVVLGLGFMLLGENSHDVTRRLAVRLEEVKKSLPPGIVVEPVYARTDLVDRMIWFRAPSVIGGDGLPGIAAFGIDTVAEAPRWQRVRVDILGDDLLETFIRPL